MSAVVAANVADSAMRIIVACGLLLGCLIVLGVVLWYYRRWLRADDEAGSPVWTFEDLRKLREQGDLSEDEYQALRSSLLGSYRTQPGRDGSMPTPVKAEDSSLKGTDFDLEKSPPG